MSIKGKLALLLLTVLVATAAAVKVEVSHSKQAPYASAFSVTTSQAVASNQCTGPHCVRPLGGIPYCSGNQGLNCTVHHLAGGGWSCTESLCTILPPIEIDPS